MSNHAKRNMPAISLLIAAMELSTAFAAAIPLAPPKPEIFWRHRPVKDPATILLWQFDEEAPAVERVADDTKLNAMLDTINEREDLSTMMETMLPSPKASFGFTRNGDAAPSPEGRFGGAIRIRGQGWIESDKLEFLKTIVEQGTAVLDFWIRPEQNLPDSQFFALQDKNRAGLFSIWRKADGQIYVRDAKGFLFAHPRGAPAGQWTHVALKLAERKPGELLIDGTPSGIDTALLTRLSAAAMEPSISSFRLGGSPEVKTGFRGEVDAVRLTRGIRLFYELVDDSFCDRAAARPIEKGAAWFAWQKPPSVYCSFDSTLKPGESGGSGFAGEAGKDMFQPGVRGMALELQPAVATNFALSGRGILPSERGTIEFWFQPLDWDNFFAGNEIGNNIPSRTVLRFAKKGAPPNQYVRALVLREGRSGKEQKSMAAWTPFHPGRWTHLVCAWDGAARKVYLDGKPQVLNQVYLAGPSRPAEQTEYEQWLKSDGEQDKDAYALSFPSPTILIDELRVYPWAFTEEEANNSFVRYLPEGRSRLVELPRLLASTAYDYYQQSLAINVAAKPVDDIEPVAASIRILRKSDKAKLLDVPRITLDGSSRGGWCSKVPLEYEPYELQVETMAADGKVLKRLSREMDRKQPPWWRNNLGKDAIVPKPWTPIEVSGTTIKVWGREYALGDGGLVTGIVSAASQLFATPPRLRGKINGAEACLTGEPAKLVSQSPQKVEWQGSMLAQGLRANLQASLEYDGLLNYTVTFLPEGTPATTIDSLTLEFPLRRARATQYIVNGGGHNFRASWLARFIPDGTNRVWDSRQSPWPKGVAFGNFCPLVWIGDDHRGLAFFGENDKGWTPTNSLPAQEIIRDAETVVYRMNIISRPVTIDKSRTFTFVLHPTPTKALPSDWRSLNGRGADRPDTVRDGVDAFLGFTLTAPAASPNVGITFAAEPVSWEDAQRNAREVKKKIGGNPVLFYMDCSWPQMGPSMAEFKPTLWWTGRMTWSREVEDYWVWLVNEYLRRDIIDGLYIDDVSFGSTRAFYSTAYQTDDGQTQPGFNTMGFRRFLQRVWVLFEKQGKRPIIVPHMTYCFEIPALSFAECTVNGEDRDIGPFAAHKYPQVWSLEELRVMGSSLKWGFVTFWKPGVRADFDYRFSQKARVWIHSQSRAMHAIVVPHDYWYLWCWPTANGIRPVLAKFGLDDPSVRFIPYWDLQGCGSATGPKTLLTIYAKPDRALIMVSNLHGADQEVTVTLDPQQLFGRDQKAAVKWTDIDVSLMPPKTGYASAADIKEVNRTILERSDVMEETNVGPDPFAEFLETSSPADKERQPFLLRTEGNRATMLVRTYDYRLLEVTCSVTEKP